MPILSYPTFTVLSNPADVARYNIQVESAQPKKYLSFGQVFAKGLVPNTAYMGTKIGTQTFAAQMDVKTKYDDGSVCFAVMTVKAPAFTAAITQHAKIFTVTTAPAAPLDLASELGFYNVKVDLTGDVNITIDIKAKLLAALANGTATYWLKGAYATQARVDIPIIKGFHIVADVTAYSDDTYQTDLQFRNDYSMTNNGGDVNYTANISRNGSNVYNSGPLTHGNYKTWRYVLNNFGMPTSDTHLVQHEVGDMIKAGALLNYDLTSGIDTTSFDNTVVTTNIVPFSDQNLEKYMPNTGARDDIGPMPAWHARWLKSQDIKAAKAALVKAQAAGSIPWHHFDPNTGDYLSLVNYPQLWIDGGNRGVVDLTQQPTDTSWTLDTAHTPALSFIPYLFTGERYYLDELNAQATYVLMATWADIRQNGQGLVLNEYDQVRGQAWSFRAIQEAAWSNPDGTTTKTYWEGIVNNNYDNMLNYLIPKYNGLVGQVAGYVPGDYRSDTSQTALGCFQQEFIMSVLGIASVRGDTKATQIITWLKNWSLGRFNHQAQGLGLAAAVAYIFYLSDNSGNLYDTWTELGTANGNSNTLPNNGEYWVPLGIQTLANIYNITGDAQALSIYNSIKSQNLLGTTTADYQTIYPQYHIVPKN